MAGKFRAAVIGASGIGKHHAKWLNNLGCDVVAFVGSSAQSVHATGQMLYEQFSIEAEEYTDVKQMLKEAEPQIVNICSPPEFHYEHFMAAVEDGCHIMCEKPLTWDEDKRVNQLLQEAQQMTEAGPGRQVCAVNTQYVAGGQAYYDLCEQLGKTPGPPEKFFMQIDSRHTNKVYERVWIDIATHPLSLVMALCGPGQIVADSEQLLVKEKEVGAHFSYQPLEGSVCDCEIVLRAWRTEGELVRRFGINDILVDYAGRNDENGVFCTYLTLDDTEVKSEDFMYLSLKQFVDAVKGEAESPLATIDDGYVNLQMQLALLSAATRQ